MTAASSAFRCASSHSSEAMSRWLVGSSSSSRSGSPASARPSDARVSSPPEKVSSLRSSTDVVLEAEPVQRRERPLAPGVAAGVLERGLRVGVGGQRRLLVVAVGHALLELAPARASSAISSGRPGEHVVAQRHLAFARRALVVQRDLRALGEHELATVDRRLARDHPQQRRLAGAVASGQASCGRGARA